MNEPKLFTKTDLAFFLDWAIVRAKTAMMNSNLSYKDVKKAEPLLQLEIMGLMERANAA